MAVKMERQTKLLSVAKTEIRTTKRTENNGWAREMAHWVSLRYVQLCPQPKRGEGRAETAGSLGLLSDSLTPGSVMDDAVPKGENKEVCGRSGHQNPDFLIR